MRDLEVFLESKGAEYASFNPTRAPKLLAKLGLKFSKNQSIIQIIGTNGKGSTGRFLALMLKTLGVKVGHFTSPHLLHFRSRPSGTSGFFSFCKEMYVFFPVFLNIFFKFIKSLFYTNVNLSMNPISMFPA